MKIDPNDIVERYCRDWDGVTPYARATIVHTDGAMAAKAGAKAVVTSDGTLIGWIGGGCIRGAVLRAARQAMDAAVPRLIRVRPQARRSPPIMTATASRFTRAAVRAGAEPTCSSSRSCRSRRSW